MSPDYSEEDIDRADGAKPRPKGKIPYLPDRSASLPELRQWLSVSIGLPPQVKVQSVHRPGRDDNDPLSITLSNDLVLRCAKQKRLQMARSLQSFLASESDGIASAPYLSPPEVGDVYIALCRLGTAGERIDPVADLQEQIGGFLAIGGPYRGTLALGQRYDTLLALKAMPRFDRTAAMAMREGLPTARPVIITDAEDDRHLRASEWVTYLRFVIGRVVDERRLVAEMREAGSERVDVQAWNGNRTHKLRAIFYSVPAEL